ncbi:hypothetical protein Chor_010806 [Crotalus horridus]
MVSVVDTPGLFDSANYNEIVRREIVACIELSRPGPPRPDLGDPGGALHRGRCGCRKLCLGYLWGRVRQATTVVLFTCLEDLGGAPLQEYVQKSDNRNLRDLIRRCGNHYCGFNNKATGTERDRQVSELMATVQSVVSENRGRYYVNRLYGEPSLRDEHVRLFVKQNRKLCRRLINLLVSFRLACCGCRNDYSIL